MEFSVWSYANGHQKILLDTFLYLILLRVDHLRASRFRAILPLIQG